MRLNKFISQCGIASRRKADLLIQQGQVRINGQVVNSLGTQVDAQKDEVAVNGKKCQFSTRYIYLALNKPAGYICTHARYRGEKSIFYLLPRKFQHLKIAGRLDKDSQGLLVLSDDGEFIYQLTHPKFEHEKEYQVALQRPLNKDEINLLKTGVRLEEGIARFDSFRQIANKRYSVVLHQGWKRQIRRMFDKVGVHINDLLRVRISKLTLAKLESRKFIELSKKDLI
ncbi:rRNA pseudouridine synthase [Patescibacteria group bacterium]|nr:rRNA pseudouridine synthase [Patescibacteria group bacterium]MBU0964555.1 rRNA pseudouridine synthase [Patescibacteria group bacterium]